MRIVLSLIVVPAVLAACTSPHVGIYSSTDTTVTVLGFDSAQDKSTADQIALNWCTSRTSRPMMLRPTGTTQSPRGVLFSYECISG